MKRWVSTHPRKKRGESMSVVVPKEERCEDEKREVVQMQEKPEISIPEVGNFIETEEVRKLKDKIKLWVNAGYPVHLIGPTGCGKSVLALQCAKDLGKKVVWINGDEELSTSHLVGGYIKYRKEGIADRFVHNVFKTRNVEELGWVDNPLTIACKYGYTLIYNEFARSKPSANNVLLSIFQEGILELPRRHGEERYIKVHPDFSSILTSNSIEYAGIHRPQDALLDRMIAIYMDFYGFETELKITMSHSHIPEAEARKVVSAIRMIRDRLESPEKPGTRACVLLANGLEEVNNFSKNSYIDLCTDVISSNTNKLNDFLKKRKIVEEVIRSIRGEKRK